MKFRASEQREKKKKSIKETAVMLVHFGDLEERRDAGLKLLQQSV